MFYSLCWYHSQSYHTTILGHYLRCQRGRAILWWRGLHSMKGCSNKGLHHFWMCCVLRREQFLCCSTSITSIVLRHAFDNLSTQATSPSKPPVVVTVLSPVEYLSILPLCTWQLLVCISFSYSVTDGCVFVRLLCFAEVHRGLDLKCREVLTVVTLPLSVVSVLV